MQTFSFSFELTSPKSSLRSHSQFLSEYIADADVTLLFFFFFLTKSVHHKVMEGGKLRFFSSIDKSRVHWVLWGNFDL